MNHEVRFMIRSPERGAVREGNCLFLGSMMTFFPKMGIQYSPLLKNGGVVGGWGEGDGRYCLSSKRAKEESPGDRASSFQSKKRVGCRLNVVGSCGDRRKKMPEAALGSANRPGGECGPLQLLHIRPAPRRVLTSSPLFSLLLPPSAGF